MPSKFLIIILCLVSFFARSDSLLISLSCVTESDFNSDKNIHGVVMIEVNRQTKVLDMQQLKPYQMVEILSRE